MPSNCSLKIEQNLRRIFYKRIRNHTTEVIRKSKREYFVDAVNSVEDNPKRMWKILKKLLPSKRTKTPTKINIEGKSYTSLSDIANSFNELFTTVADKITSHFESSTLDNVSMLTKNKLNITFASPNSISKIISKLNISKGIGVDELSVKTFKFFCKTSAFVKSLAEIINCSFKTGCFPNIWKKQELFLFSNLETFIISITIGQYQCYTALAK